MNLMFATLLLQTAFYTFVGAGSSVSTFGSNFGTFHGGAGGEYTARNGLGAGAEFGYVAPRSNASNGVALLSLNGLYRFTQGRTEPFLTGGYSLGFRSRAASFGNIGGGVTYWARENLGIRFELRDNIRDPATHWVIARFGVAFR